VGFWVPYRSWYRDDGGQGCDAKLFGAHVQNNTQSHVVPRCRSPNPRLPQQQDTIPYAVKKSQSCAPEDGQKFARNVLSWSWRSINCYGCISLVFCITLSTLMMHGQTQIKFTQSHLWRPSSLIGKLKIIFKTYSNGKSSLCDISIMSNCCVQLSHHGRHKKSHCSC
jgi:hypothetical protein